MNLNEVAPPGWGHTKAEKEKTKPNKPKSKIGGSAAAFKRALDDGRFKGLPGDKTKKEKTASMFKLMWSMKNKGDKPHYKPGTDEKKKKYQEESSALDANTKLRNQKKRDKMAKQLARLMIHARDQKKNPVLANSHEVEGEMVEELSRRSKPSAIRKKKTLEKLLIDKEVSKVQKEDWKPEIEHVKGSDLRKKAAEKKRKEAADSLPPHLRLDTMKKAFAQANEATTMQDNNLFGDAYATLKKKVGSKKKHDKPAVEEGIMQMVKRAVKKKEERKPQKAMDAGARAKRKLARAHHAKYVSGSEDLVPDDIRETVDDLEQDNSKQNNTERKDAIANQIKSKENRQKMIKKQVLLKKLQAVRAGAASDITASYKPEGEVVNEDKRISFEDFRKK